MRYKKPAWIAVAVFVSLFFSSSSRSDEVTPATKERAYFYFILGTLSSLESDSKNALEFYQNAAKFDPESDELMLHQAEELLNLGQSSEGKDLLKKIAKSEQKNPEYFLLVARVSSQDGELAPSVKALDQATRLFMQQGNSGKARETLLTKVALLADNHKYRESVQALEKFLRTQPDDEIAYFFLGKIHSIFQNREAAKRAFIKALQLRPGFIAAAKALGLQYELEGKLPEAIKVYQTALRSGGGDEELVQKLVNLSLIADDYTKALDYLTYYLSLRPDDTQSQLRAALINYKLKNYAEAKRIFQSILKTEGPGKDRILFYLGTLCEEQNDFQEAIGYYEQIKPNSEYFVESRLQLSAILSTKLKKPQDAIRSLAEAVDLRSDSPDLFLALASEHEQQNQVSESIRVLTHASELFKDNEKILFMLGSLLDRAGDFEAGIKKMQQVLTINPNNAHALNHIGYTYAEHKMKLTEAESLLKKALQISPDNGFIIDSLGWTYYQMGKFKQAVKLLERANTLSPNQPVILEHLADTYQKVGNSKQALEVYKRIMRSSAKDDQNVAESETEIQAIKDRVKEKIAFLDHNQPN